MNVYAFDVDETLEVSGGPVTLQAVADLRSEGHVTGICGNWAVMCHVPRWHLICSFVGPAHNACECGRPYAKADFLRQLMTYMPGERYIMVGNDPEVFGASDDKNAAEAAGWAFLREIEFAQGAR